MISLCSLCALWLFIRMETAVELFAIASTVGADLRVCPGGRLYTQSGAPHAGLPLLIRKPL